MMKTTLIALTLALTAPLAAAQGLPNHHEHHQATRGGVFEAGAAADYELVAKPERLQLYVFNHGSPRDLAKATAKLTLLTGGQTQEVTLKPAGDKLEATGQFKLAPGTKVVAVVIDGGKTLGTVRFTLK